jgi:hypothetical protein
MEKEELIERLVNECLYDFDFDKVHRVMVATNFTWGQEDGDAVPSVAQLVIEGMRLLREVARFYGDGKRHSSRFGGLKATMEDEYLKLEFVLEVGWANV